MERRDRILDTVSRQAIEFQVQIAVPAEELRGGDSFGGLNRIRYRVEDALALATTVCGVLEPRGWRVTTVRFEEEVCITLARHATAELVARDLANLPGEVRERIGAGVHICVSVGEHIFELAFADGGLRPFSQVDSQSSSAPA